MGKLVSLFSALFLQRKKGELSEGYVFLLQRRQAMGSEEDLFETYQSTFYRGEPGLYPRFII